MKKYFKNYAVPISDILFICGICAMLYVGEYIPFVFVVTACVLKAVVKSLDKDYDEIPTYYKRFTRNTDDGSIIAEKENINEIIVYLNEVENYLDNRVKYK